jgi:protein tyrosine phosphatase (PTP) superfamily phosphohydrolase (DUF442 family)
MRLFLIMLVGLAAGCSPEPQLPGQANRSESANELHEISPRPTSRTDSIHLPNLVQVSDLVYSGGLPVGDPAFARLRSLGIKTVISVDGQTPDVETAKRFGLRYVHLPHGYDGIPKLRAQELAKAVLEFDGPIYFHCHHGKHRSPAAASVACITAGLVSAEQGLATLQAAGTSPHYVGLFKSVETAGVIPRADLDSLDVVFREIAEIPPMAEAMVAIEHTFGNLERLADANWQPPNNHPDLDPAHQALMLKEHFTEMLRAEYVQPEPAGFQQILGHSRRLSEQLEDCLRQQDATDDQTSTEDTESADRILKAIRVECKQCHQQFRDQPLAE